MQESSDRHHYTAVGLGSLSAALSTTGDTFSFILALELSSVHLLGVL